MKQQPFTLCLFLASSLLLLSGADGTLLRGERQSSKQDQEDSNRRLRRTNNGGGTMRGMRMAGGGSSTSTAKRRAPRRMFLALQGKQGSLGRIRAKVAKGNEARVQKDTEEILQEQLEAQESCSKVRLQAHTTDLDPKGHAHVRLIQTLHGMPVEGAALVAHIHPNGTLTGINGEFCDDEQPQDLLRALDDSDLLDPETLLDMALKEAGIEQGEWVGEPERAVVRREHGGSACLAWKQSVRYNVTEGGKGDGPQLDWIYADATYSIEDTATDRDNAIHNEAVPNVFQHLFREDPHAHKFYATAPNRVLCARHPRYRGSGIPSLQTLDCNQRTSFCTRASTSSSRIDTGDAALDAAHNGAIATYEYFWNAFGRDSLDGSGMDLVSRVHYDRGYNNAFWDGRQMTYGDGDGVTFRPFSLDVDVVAHELTHGLTQFTSGLVYQRESGALNEAMSDVFGAMVDRQEGASGDDVWKVGEDVYTPNVPGDAFRNMANPTQTGDRDFYPERYVGNADNGGVHTNSGIANLAFHLLVVGGRHPRRKTSVVVQGIGFEAAAAIFYYANIDCLTPSATFEMARYCTAEAFGGEHRLNVHQAWDAVGVPGGPPPPPIALQDGVTVAGQSGSSQQEYRLEPINTGDTVTCSFTASSGDPDLYARFGEDPSVWPDWRDNDCSSFTPTTSESCTTPPAESPATLHVLVDAADSLPYNDLEITCSINRQAATETSAPTPAPTSNPAASDDRCCSDFEGESACNKARIGEGFGSYRCKWCRGWFGFGDAECTADFNLFCR